MKNKKKIIIAIILVLIFIIIALFLKKFIILNNFFKSRIEMFSLKNYHLTVTDKNNDIKEMIFKDNEYIEKEINGNIENIWYIANNKQLRISKDNINKTGTVYNSPINPNITIFPQSYYSIYADTDKLSFSTVFYYTLNLHVSTDSYNGEKVYIIENNDIKTIIRKKDYRTIEETYQNETNNYNLEIGNVTSEDLEEIDLTGFSIENI